MTTIIKPTIGRRVWFRPSHAFINRNPTFAQMNPEQPMDAGIVYVHNDHMVNLAVCDHVGRTHMVPSVPLLAGQWVPDDADGIYMGCEWPPRQVTQVAREADAAPANPHGRCQGERCTSTDGFGHSRECIAEAGRNQGWDPTAEDLAGAGPSAEAEPIVGEATSHRDLVQDLAALTPLISAALENMAPEDTKHLRQNLAQTLASLTQPGPVVLPSDMSEKDMARIKDLFAAFHDGVELMVISEQPWRAPVGLAAIEERHRHGDGENPIDSTVSRDALENLAAEMPGGAAGYMKTWGYHDFARAAVHRFSNVGHCAQLQERNENQAATIAKLMADVKRLDEHADKLAGNLRNRRATIDKLVAELERRGVFVAIDIDGRLVEVRPGA